MGACTASTVPRRGKSADDRSRTISFRSGLHLGNIQSQQKVKVSDISAGLIGVANDVLDVRGEA